MRETKAADNCGSSNSCSASCSRAKKITGGRSIGAAILGDLARGLRIFETFPPLRASAGVGITRSKERAMRAKIGICWLRLRWDGRKRVKMPVNGRRRARIKTPMPQRVRERRMNVRNGHGLGCSTGVANRKLNENRSIPITFPIWLKVNFSENRGKN